MFYSKATGGFYDRAIHGDQVPDDAVEISKEFHAQLLAGQSSGKRIQADQNGRPYLADLAPITVEEMAAAARRKRDALLAGSDWVVIKAAESGQAIPAAWVAYRQALRDITAQPGFPTAITWPTTTV